MIYQKFLHPVIFVILLLVSVEGCSAPPPTPDRVATGVTEAKVVAATLTAQPPMARPTYTALPIPTKTSTPKPTLTPTASETHLPAVLSFTPESKTAGTSKDLQLSGRLIETYTSSCDFFDHPEFHPRGDYRVIFHNTSYTITGCTTLDEDFLAANTTAMIVRLQNMGATNVQITVPWPDELIISNGDETKSAHALFYNWSLEILGWVSEGKGEQDLEIKPGNFAELLYLLPKIHGENTITLPKIGSFTIHSANSP